MKEKTMSIIYGIIAILLVVAFFKWMDARDEQLARGAKTYEKCVYATYNMTPIAYWTQHGKWPECK